jgi:hypothetical protein
MAPPYTLGNDLRIFDQMIYEWLDTLKINYGSIAGTPRQQFGILRCFATPHRATAEMEQLLVRKGWLDPNNPGIGDGTDEHAVETWKRIPLPFVSIYRQPPVPDEARFIRSGVTALSYTPDLRSTTSSAAPYPLNIPYQLDFWYKRKFSEAFIWEWVFAQLGSLGSAYNELFRTVTIGSGWGDKIIPIRFDSMSDNSDLEPGEANRTLRSTVDFTVKAWMFPPLQTNGTGANSNKIVGTVIKEEIEMCRQSLERVNLFGYNSLISRSFHLTNVSGNASLDTPCCRDPKRAGHISKTQWDNQCKFVMSFTPGNPTTDYIQSCGVPVWADTYAIEGDFVSENTWTLQVLNSSLVVIRSWSMPASRVPLHFYESFDNLSSNPVVSVKINSNEEINFSYFGLQRMTYTV